jgi:hypothetical protein
MKKRLYSIKEAWNARLLEAFCESRSTKHSNWYMHKEQKEKGSELKITTGSRKCWKDIDIGSNNEVKPNRMLLHDIAYMIVISPL